MSARTTVGAPAVALLLVLISGCSGGDDSTVADASPTVTPAASAATSVPADVPPDSTMQITASSPPSSSPPSSSAPSSTPATTAAPTTTTEPARPFGDVSPIDPTTPTDGNGTTPTLAWQPVDGAVSYSVVVLDPDGAAWWAWEGEATEVILGGVADGPGALSTRPGTTWTVIAFDASGSVLAATVERRLDP